MKIGINSRIIQNVNTGIPYFVRGLYQYLQDNDKKDTFFFFQTENKNVIGTTKTIRTWNNLLGVFLFDNFLVSKLLKQERIDIFHGPANILPFFKRKNTKYVVTIHDLSSLIFKEHHSALFNIYYKYAVKRTLF